MKANTPILTMALLAAAMGAANARAAAGFIQFVSGDARVALVSGGERAAQKGVELNEGDTVITGRGASMQLRMADEGLIAVRPDTQLKIETYRYSGREDGKERGVLSLLRGGFRTLTGFIGRNNKQNYLVRAPNATIGIRGTDHEIVHIPVPAPGETALGVPGTYNKVNVGETFMETPAGRIDLGANQVGFANLAAGIAPVRLDSVPTFLRATPQQQGRDDRRQVREAAPADQRRIAQQQQQQQQPQGQQPQQQAKPHAGQPQGQQPQGQQPQPGSQQQAGIQQQGLLQQPGFQPLAGTVRPQQALAVVNPVNTVDKDNTVGTATTTQTLKIAPDRYAMVGGDFSPSRGVGSGAIVQGEGGSIYFGQDGQFALVSRPSDGFSYTRSGVPNVASGGAILTDGASQIPVQWGIYSGGSIVDSSGSRTTQFFHFMSAQGTPLSVVNNLSGSYNAVLASTKLITENGILGGGVTSANITVNSGKLMSYSIQAVDAQARNWSGNCSVCASGVALTTFSSKGVDLSGTGPSGTTSGKAHGAPIGPSGAGMISSFNLKTSNGQGVTGAFAVK